MSQNESSPQPQPQSQPQLQPPSPVEPDAAAERPTNEPDESLASTLKTILIGKPRDLHDKSLFKHLSLIAVLAWVGLGADGLSSSCYGPAEAFHALHDHSYLGIFLAIATIATVFIISACYSHIIEVFPGGGGGYVVATKLLGRPVGLVSGCALLVDYALTITVSTAAAGDALFGLLDPAWSQWKLTAELVTVVGLIVINLRGVKESVMMLLPIFILFLVMHVGLIGGAILVNASGLPDLVSQVGHEVTTSVRDPKIGFMGVASMLLYAYSLGAGTYTGIEAVSNSMPVMREPRVATGKRTMLLMAVSLALTAGGLILAYLLLKIRWTEGQTMNQTLVETLVQELRLPTGPARMIVLVTMISEGALLVVAAQAGFIDGPRVLSNMAHDSWVPHRFASLSERLTTHNGVLLMGGSAIAALWATRGDVATLVLMYSINVFVTFSLSMVAMLWHWWRQPRGAAYRRRRLALFGVGAALCTTILVITVAEKFLEGGWITIAVTGACVGVCLVTRRYYQQVTNSLRRLDDQLLDVSAPPAGTLPVPALDREAPTAIVLVGGYGGLGVHTFFKVQQFIPRHFRNFVFVSVGVVDSSNFKGEEAVDEIKEQTAKSLEQYVGLANRT
ncbi:MAG TPA: APC family permease, partial [Pirellulaceae bacterium]|nr:APC family permease [Pirellulaceae bacterium]